MANPLSIRINDELKEEFKALSEQSGMKQEDFVATLLTNFKERQVETDTGSPVHREKVKVTQALSQVERVVCSFLEIAHNDKAVAISSAQEQVELTRDKFVSLEETIKENDLKIEGVLKDKKALEVKLSSLEEQAKSLQALENAWTEKETALNGRIAELDTEAKETRKIKSELSKAETLIQEQKNSIALAKQQATTDKEIIKEIKGRLGNKDVALEQARADLQQVKDDANQQVVIFTQKHAEEKGSLTAQLKIMSENVTELKAELIKPVKGKK